MTNIDEFDPAIGDQFAVKDVYESTFTLEAQHGDHTDNGRAHTDHVDDTAPGHTDHSDQS